MEPWYLNTIDSIYQKKKKSLRILGNRRPNSLSLWCLRNRIRQRFVSLGSDSFSCIYIIMYNARKLETFLGFETYRKSGIGAAVGLSLQHFMEVMVWYSSCTIIQFGSKSQFALIILEMRFSNFRFSSLF